MRTLNTSLSLLLGAILPVFADQTLDLLQDPGQWTPRDTAEGIYTIEDSTLTALRRSYQSATILTKQDYENFELNFDFRVFRWCELVMLIHPAWNAADEAGLQLLLSDHDTSAPSPTHAGALLNKIAPTAQAMNPDGVWNTCRVKFDWPTFEVDLNGQAIQRVDLSDHKDLRHTLRRGPIGFRDLLGWGFEVRNMHLTPLPDTENAIQLYNGKDFTGWKEVRPRDATWEAKGDIIVGDNGNGYLQHETLTQDFDLRLYYRTTPTANGGVFFRWAPDDSDRGNEIQILDVPETTMPSGSIYSIDRADPNTIRPVGQWQLLQVSLRGNHAITRLNGRPCAETTNITTIRPGHITLQMHKEKSTIEFRDLHLVVHDNESGTSTSKN